MKLKLILGGIGTKKFVMAKEVLISISNYSEIRNQSQFLSFNELEDKKKAIEAAKIRINANAKISDVMKLLIMTLKEK